jgi:hypothetical protein
VHFVFSQESNLADLQNKNQTHDTNVDLPSTELKFSPKSAQPKNTIDILVESCLITLMEDKYLGSDIRERGQGQMAGVAAKATQRKGTEFNLIRGALTSAVNVSLSPGTFGMRAHSGTYFEYQRQYRYLIRNYIVFQCNERS